MTHLGARISIRLSLRQATFYTKLVSVDALWETLLQVAAWCPWSRRLLLGLVRDYTPNRSAGILALSRLGPGARSKICSQRVQVLAIFLFHLLQRAG
jgi:hypothetical protein